MRMVFFNVCLYLYCPFRPNYQEERYGIPFAGLTLSQFCARSKAGPVFPYVMVFCVFNDLRGLFS